MTGIWGSGDSSLMGRGGSNRSCDHLVLLPEALSGTWSIPGDEVTGPGEKGSEARPAAPSHSPPNSCWTGVVSLGSWTWTSPRGEESHDSSLGSAVQVDRTQGYWILCSNPRRHLLCFTVLHVCLFPFSRATLAAYGGSETREPIGAAAASLNHNHSNAGSEPHL